MAYKLVNGRSPNWAFMEKFVVPHYDDPKGTPYLVRWRLIQCPWFGVYLHKLGTEDPRDVLHNHPWGFVSFIIKGGYDEFTPSRIGYAESRRIRFINVKRFSNSFHWISNLHRTPTWTLMFVGRRRRVWGYLDRDGTYTDYNKHVFNDQFMKALAEQGDAA